MQTPIQDTLPDQRSEVDAADLADAVQELAQMNSDDWSSFLTQRMDEVRVEFAFSAPNEQAATELGEALQDDAAYAVSVEAPDGDEADWTVTGTTPGVSVTEVGLDEWVEKLVAFGLDHGGCVLDGWAVEPG